MTTPPKTPQKLQEARKFPAQHDESYPADMEAARGAPRGIGQAKPGPKNPDPAQTAAPEDGDGKDLGMSRG